MNNIAVVFPGQGSQTVGMLADIAERFSEVKQTFSEASQVLGYDLWQIVHKGPTEVLDKTEHTQPAVLTASCALWRILKNNLETFKPQIFAGHSLGEYSALVCANSLDFNDAVRLVSARAKFMQEAVPAEAGAMAAIIGLDENAVEALCIEALGAQDEVLSPANYNSPGQVVIAGNKGAVLRAVDLAKTQGARLAILIPVSVPSHCKLMLEASKRLEELMENIHFEEPEITVLSNADVVPYTNAKSIRNGLAKQLYMPVRWVEIVQYIIEKNVHTIIECGPGKVLNGLNRRINKNLELKSTLDTTALLDLLKFENTILR